MINLREETLENFNSVDEFNDKVAWAKIAYSDDCVDFSYCFKNPEEWIDKEKGRVFILEPNHTYEQALEFLSYLDFEYYDGYGHQEVVGYIVLKDGTWYSRREYDGAEWWEYNKCPNYEDNGI